MKKGIFIICLLAVNMAFSQTWSHSRSNFNKDGEESFEKLEDVTSLTIDFYHPDGSTKTIVTGFLYYNMFESNKMPLRYTPTCNCKLISEGYAKQVFKASDGYRTQVSLSWDDDSVEYRVSKLIDNNWRITEGEFFVRHKN